MAKVFLLTTLIMCLALASVSAEENIRLDISALLGLEDGAAMVLTTLKQDGEMVICKFRRNNAIQEMVAMQALSEAEGKSEFFRFGDTVLLFTGDTAGRVRLWRTQLTLSSADDLSLDIVHASASAVKTGNRLRIYGIYNGEYTVAEVNPETLEIIEYQSLEGQAPEFFSQGIRASEPPVNNIFTRIRLENRAGEHVYINAQDNKVFSTDELPDTYTEWVTAFVLVQTGRNSLNIYNGSQSRLYKFAIDDLPIEPEFLNEITGNIIFHDPMILYADSAGCVILNGVGPENSYKREIIGVNAAGEILWKMDDNKLPAFLKSFATNPASRQTFYIKDMCFARLNGDYLEIWLDKGGVEESHAVYDLKNHKMLCSVSKGNATTIRVANHNNQGESIVVESMSANTGPPINLLIPIAAGAGVIILAALAFLFCVPIFTSRNSEETVAEIIEILNSKYNKATKRHRADIKVRHFEVKGIYRFSLIRNAEKEGKWGFLLGDKVHIRFLKKHPGKAKLI